MRLVALLALALLTAAPPFAAANGVNEKFDPDTAIFIGSSTMGHWKPRMDSDFKGIPTLNFGENGTTFEYLLENVPAWSKEFPAKRWVIYSGDNDLNDEHPKKPAEVIAQMKKTIELIRANVPDARVFVISLKCRITPEGQAAKPAIEEANRLMEAAAKEMSGVTFVNTYAPMRAAMKAPGAQPGDFFDEDGIHLNDRGYDIWRNTLKPLLEKSAKLRPSAADAADAPGEDRPGTTAAN